MSDPEHQRSYFKKRYAEDPEFRRRRREVNNDYWRRRSAGDPEWRARESARCAGANRNARLMRRHGITVDAFDAQLASQLREVGRMPCVEPNLTAAAASRT
jgi:hypothetical protein